MRRGYRRVRGDFTPYLADLDLRPHGRSASAREALLAALRGYFAHRGIEANWNAIKRLPDDMLVVTLAWSARSSPRRSRRCSRRPTDAERAAASC